MYPVFFGIKWLEAYIVLSVIGFAAAFIVAMFRRKSYGYTVRDLVSMLCASIIGLILGAKILFSITQIPAIVEHNFSWEVINARVINGGLVFYGGLIGAFVCIYFLAKYMKKDAPLMMSFVAPCFTAFHAFGRIGCLLNGCCYGIISDHGVNMNGEKFVATGELVKRVPIQLYEAIILVLITVALLLLENYHLKNEKPYNAVPVYILMYAPARFILEIFRGDVVRGVFTVNYTTGDGPLDGSMEFVISTSQIVSLMLLLGVAVYYIVKSAIRKHDAKKAIPEPAARTAENTDSYTGDVNTESEK